MYNSNISTRYNLPTTAMRPKEGGEIMAQAQDKHCDGCGWTGYTSSDTCPKCGRELSDD
jgi:hypothetical protein